MPFAFLRRRPLVSICIPAYQSQAFIAKTLDSALAQTVQDIEIMLKNTRDNIESDRINYERVLPYGNLTGLVFYGFKGLLFFISTLI